MIVRESLNFERGLDPKRAMGTGKEAEINQWLIKQDFTGNDDDYFTIFCNWNKTDFAEWYLKHHTISEESKTQGLNTAIIERNNELIKILLDNNVKTDKRTIAWSIEYQNIDLCKLAIDKTKLSPKITNELLAKASSYGNLEIIKILVEKGGDPTFNFNKSLQNAAASNKIDTISYLAKLITKR